MFDFDESSRRDEDMMLEGAFSDLLETTHAVSAAPEQEPLLQLMEELMAGLDAAAPAPPPEPAPVPEPGPASSGSSLLSLAGIVEALGDVSKAGGAPQESGGEPVVPGSDPEFPADFDVTAAREAEAAGRAARELALQTEPAGPAVEPSVEGMLEELLDDPGPLAGPVPRGSVVPEPTPLTSLIEAMESEVIRDSSAARVRTREVPEAAEPRAAQDSCIVFGLDGTRYAVPMRNVIEIDTVPRITPVPRTPGFVRGVTNRRGEVYCVIDLRGLLGMELAASQPRQRILVMRASRDLAAAMVVDEVRGTTALALGALAGPVGPVNDKVADLLLGVGQHQDQILNVLDVEKLFASPEVRRLTGSE